MPNMRTPSQINVVEVNGIDIDSPPPVERPDKKLVHTAQVKEPNCLWLRRGSWISSSRSISNNSQEEEKKTGSQPMNGFCKRLAVSSTSVFSSSSGSSSESDIDHHCSNSKSMKVQSVSIAKKELSPSSLSTSPTFSPSSSPTSKSVTSPETMSASSPTFLSSSPYSSIDIFNTLPAHLSLGPDVFDANTAPPFPDPLIKPENNNPAYRTKVFRVINVYNNGMITLRSHAKLNSYLHMDAALQKFYTENDDYIKYSYPITEKNIVKMGYYVAKMGKRYERCQFLKFTALKEITNFHLRIRLLDFGVPLVVPYNVLRPMHKGFKVLAAQGYTAQIFDYNPKFLKAGQPDPESLRKAMQDKVYTVNIIKMDYTFPECPHIYCNFIEELKK